MIEYWHDLTTTDFDRGELETSLLLHLRADVVRHEALRDFAPPGSEARSSAGPGAAGRLRVDESGPQPYSRGIEDKKRW
jgi:hypothetical protein